VASGSFFPLKILIFDGMLKKNNDRIDFVGDNEIIQMQMVLAMTMMKNKLHCLIHQLAVAGGGERLK